MAIQPHTPPVRGGERPRLPSAQIGPVTQAIRAMRAAEPVETETVSVLAGRSGSPKLVSKSDTVSCLPPTKTDIVSVFPGSPAYLRHGAESETVAHLTANLDRQRIRDLSRRIAERIQADIALLNASNGGGQA